MRRLLSLCVGFVTGLFRPRPLEQADVPDAIRKLLPVARRMERELDARRAANKGTSESDREERRALFEAKHNARKFIQHFQHLEETPDGL